VMIKMGVNSGSMLMAIQPHLQLAAKTLFQPEFRITTFAQRVGAIENNPAAAAFDSRSLSFVRSLRDSAV
jgi:hypothetical protein